MNKFYNRIFLTQRSYSIIYSIFLILPPTFLLLYIFEFGVNLIFWDEWAMVPLIQKEMSGSLTFSDLFAQHNEHRIPFARIAMLAIGKITQYNTVAEMFFSWTILCLTASLLFNIYSIKFCYKKCNERLLYFLPVLFLLFSFRQYESILMGFTCHIYLMIFGVVGAIILLEKSVKIDILYVFSFFCAFLASFSFVTGLLVWPICVLQLLLSRKKGYLRKVALWCFIGFIVSFWYFWGFRKPSGHPSLDYFFRDPIVTGRFFLTLIGAPFSVEVVMAASIGLVLMLLAFFTIVYVCKKKLVGEHSIWVSLIFFVALSSIATTVGRVGLGVDQALPSRYTPITTLGVIGLYLLILILYDRVPSKTINFGLHSILTLILLGLVISYGVGIYAGQQTKYSREMGSNVLLNYETQTDENIRKYLFPDPNYVRNHAKFLEENGLNVFANQVENPALK